MKPIIPPVDKDLLIKELDEERFLRKTNNGNNLLYIVTQQDSPNVMKEIGRLRELTFRAAGGGTGKEMDIDGYDTMPNPYKQLVVWDPSRKEILGGYRYFICSESVYDEDGNCNLATARLFRFSKKFHEEYMPHMIELGRSFVQPAYQSTNRSSKGIYALDNLWDGLGAIWMTHKHIKYFFGKVTMYTHYNVEARDLILYFMDKYFGDREHLLVPYEPLMLKTDKKVLDSILCGETYQDNYKLLSQNVRARGEVVPPLINAYMSLSPTMKCFGTAMNYSFGQVEETAIMVTLNDMYVEKYERHIKTFIPKN
ncbi:MAG: GNAT family N-acetyltransferase [Bacteroidales bacterium]|nr:GNAT family N-acetyltransferase [Bacteroidales bacterium]